MEWVTISVLGIGAFVILFPVAFIWYLNIGGIHSAIKKRTVTKLLEQAIPNLTCSIDADCPPDYVCQEGRCVPEGA